jgi:DNA-binding MarR family transcriptional regulator
MISDEVFAILRDFPRIYLACHVRHPPGRKRRSAITGRDASILAHVAIAELRPRDLARHLGLAASTVSEAVKRLIGLQLIDVRLPSNDRRAKTLRITATGRQAIAGGSVLDAAVVQAALQSLSPSRRRKVVEGLKILADAASIARQTAANAGR